MDTQDALKKAVGLAALKFVIPDSVVGVGTGSTAAYFIDALAAMKNQIAGAVSSSKASTEKLKAHGIRVFDSNEITMLEVYVDGADEINPHLQMIKGGGAALTQEKVLAAMAKNFVCIVDESKMVPVLGAFPLPVEVIPMARSYVARELIKLGGRPVYRRNVVTDNDNVILDIHDLYVEQPLHLEEKINAIAGVVTVGLFAHRPANIVLVGTSEGIKQVQSQTSREG